MSLYALVDCNNFFASCERLFRPELTNRPVAVLSNNDGCIVARSNEVKALDIPMGVPLFKVKDIVRAHNVTLFSANFELYGDVSQRIVQLLREETPLIEVYSIDECFVDLSELAGLDPEKWARRVQARVMQEVGVPVSVGIAPTKTLAKVASTYAKKHGGTWVIGDDDARMKLLDDLPIEDIWGIGRRLAPKLRDKGVSLAGQLVRASDKWLGAQFNVTGMRMIDELRGQARLPFGDSHDQRKSIMRSRSFGHTVRASHELEQAVATFASQAAARLRAQDSVCRGIVVFLTEKKDDSGRFRSSSHLVTLTEASAHTGELIRAALQALAAVYDEGAAYKKAGIVLVDIRDVGAWQLSLIENKATKRESGVSLMNAVDELNKRFGSGTVWNASESRADAHWHSKRESRSPRYTTAMQELPKLRV